MSLTVSSGDAGSFLSPSGTSMLESLSVKVDKSRPLVVIPYHWPDLDGLVAALLMQHIASRYLGFSCCLATFAETPQLEAQVWLSWSSCPFGQFAPTGEEQFVVVDTCRLEDLPSSVSAEGVVGVIDHHMHYVPSLFPNACMQIEPVGAATTLVGELLLWLQGKNATPESAQVPSIDVVVAEAAYLAIATSTIGFSAASTTSRDILVAEHMLRLAGMSQQAGLLRYEELLAEKTDRVGDNIAAAIRADIPSRPDTINEYSVIGAELQVLEARSFVEASFEVCLAELRLLTVEQRASYSWLIVSGFRDQESLVMSPFPEVIRQIQVLLGTFNGDAVSDSFWLALPTMMTRKALFSLLRTTNSP